MSWQLIGKSAKLHLPLLSHLNGELFGKPNAGVDMTFDFGQLVAHAAKTRNLGPGVKTLGSVAVSRNKVLTLEPRSVKVALVIPVSLKFA
ncbi:MAG: hypothetical protein U5L01_04420 [Rheinheimera sp.]|nr:hypothetical protein [Rheinheimera sp.]